MESEGKEKRGGIFGFHTTTVSAHLTPVAFKISDSSKNWERMERARKTGKCSKRWSLNHDPRLISFQWESRCRCSFVPKSITGGERNELWTVVCPPQVWTKILNWSFLSSMFYFNHNKSRRVSAGFAAAGMHRVSRQYSYEIELSNNLITWQLQHGIAQKCKKFSAICQYEFQTLFIDNSFITSAINKWWRAFNRFSAV